MMKKMIPIALTIFIHPKSFSAGEDLWVWAQRRFEQGPLNGLWEFPGGKVQENERPVDAAKREWAEEVGEPKDLKLLPFDLFRFDYTDRSLLFYCFVVKGIELPESKGAWYKVTRNWKENDGKYWPLANHQLLDNLLVYYKRPLA